MYGSSMTTRYTIGFCCILSSIVSSIRSMVESVFNHMSLVLEGVNDIGFERSIKIYQSAE